MSWDAFSFEVNREPFTFKKEQQRENVSSAIRVASQSRRKGSVEHFPAGWLDSGVMQGLKDQDRLDAGGSQGRALKRQPPRS